MKNNKNGSFTSFLSIILTSIIVLMTILQNAASIRKDETLITGALTQQQDLVLSNYSQKLQDWYGIFATTLLKDNEIDFNNTIRDISQAKYISCKGTKSLENYDNFKYAVLAFSKPRVPLQLSLQILSRFTEMDSIIKGNKNNLENSSLINNNIHSESENSNTNSSTSIGFQDIIKLLAFIDKSIFNKFVGVEVQKNFSWDNLNSLLKNDLPDSFQQPDVSKGIQSSLSISEKSMNDISGFFEQIFNIKSNVIYDKLAFEFYVSSMFSCRTNFRIQDNVQIDRKDMRNRTIQILPSISKFEIEKIIYGFQDEKSNKFWSEISIESIRFLFHIISYIADSSKKSEISAIAVSLCAAVLLVSAGTVAIPQNFMEIVLIILMSTSGAVNDFKMLSEGKGVKLLPMKSDINIDTYYMDYLQLFLLIVPEELKFRRMLTIMKENLYLSNCQLFTGVQVTAGYRSYVYRTDGCYYEFE